MLFVVVKIMPKKSPAATPTKDKPDAQPDKPSPAAKSSPRGRKSVGFNGTSDAVAGAIAAAGFSWGPLGGVACKWQRAILYTFNCPDQAFKLVNVFAVARLAESFWSHFFVYYLIIPRLSTLSNAVLPAQMELKAQRLSAKMAKAATQMSKDPRQLALAMNLRELQATLTFSRSISYAAFKELVKAAKGTSPKSSKKKALIQGRV